MAGAFRVEDLLAEFGKAIVSAQNTILKTAQDNPAPLEGLRTAFSIGETELDVKLIFEETGGATDIRLVSAGASRLQDLDPGVLSSLKAKILAVPDEEPTAPRRTPTQIRDEVLVRPDLQRLKGIFGELTVTARFVPGARRWLVDVTEPGGLTVRSLQVSD